MTNRLTTMSKNRRPEVCHKPPPPNPVIPGSYWQACMGETVDPDTGASIFYAAIRLPDYPPVMRLGAVSVLRTSEQHVFGPIDLVVADNEAGGLIATFTFPVHDSGGWPEDFTLTIVVTSGTDHWPTPGGDWPGPAIATWEGES